MAQPQLILAFDVVNNVLVSGWQGSRSGNPEFSQAVYTVRLYLLQPNPNAIVGSVVSSSAAYDNYDVTGFDGVRLGIWSDCTGTLDDSSSYVLALTPHAGVPEMVFTPGTDADGYDYFEGKLNVYTQQAANFLTASAAKSLGAYLACYLVSGSTLTKVYDQRNGQTNCIINASTDDGSGDLPLDMTTVVPTLPFPCHFKKGDNLYALDETSPGVVEFVWLNPH